VKGDSVDLEELPQEGYSGAKKKVPFDSERFLYFIPKRIEV
jgi:hypothetical protein